MPLNQNILCGVYNFFQIQEPKRKEQLLCFTAPAGEDTEKWKPREKGKFKAPGVPTVAHQVKELTFVSMRMQV